ncbi:hypothetical protein F8M41_001551 [Gigaspora margarita]|uniref:Uncharacterized protein n=1 Tax=Gigaspora margarita TaxID=4874 RepID=A0A8H4ESF8_GIGMA|nr:hypothetical protein F8M41_001551 [Gigaspora margarita]
MCSQEDVEVMKAYLRSTSPNEWSFNRFLYDNRSYLIANDCKNNWDVLNSVWKNKFTDIIMKQTSEEIIINKIQEEETLEHLWFYIENSQTIDVLKHHLKQKNLVSKCVSYKEEEEDEKDEGDEDEDEDDGEDEDENDEDDEDEDKDDEDEEDEEERNDEKGEDESNDSDGVDTKKTKSSFVDKILKTIKRYIETTPPNDWSYNKFLQKNEDILIAKYDHHKNWQDQNSVLKKNFIETARQTITDELIINKLKNERIDKNLWIKIANAKKEIIKIRRKINKNMKDTIRNEIRQIINNELNDIKDQIRKEISQELNDIKEQIREISQE